MFEALKAISQLTGNSSQQRKVDAMQKLLISCTDTEPKYLIRSVEGKLRIGLAQQTILISLAHAIALRDPAVAKLSGERRATVLAEAVAVVKQTFSELPSYDVIVPALLEFGWRDLPRHCELTPGIPLKPMLAHPTKVLTEVLNRFEGMEFTCNSF